MPIKEYFYEKTGIYDDWDQIKKLPDIDTLVDIGVGDIGTENLYTRFKEKGLILIDPLKEAADYAEHNLCDRKYKFFQTAVGQEKGEIRLNVEIGSRKGGGTQLGRSSILSITDLNDEGSLIEPRNIPIDTLDNILLGEKDLGRIGIKIDTEGYELEVIKGAENTLDKTKFVIVETRHNHISFEGCYKLHQFMEIMRCNNFQLTMILSAKPLIADLVFQPISDLDI